MDELEAEAEAVLEAAVAHLRETALVYGLSFDDRAHALAKQKLAQHGFKSLAEVVRFYEEPPLALHDVVQATCAQHTDNIIADLGSLAATSRELQEPSRHRHEGTRAYGDRIAAQLRAAGAAQLRAAASASTGAAATPPAFAPVPAPQVPGHDDSHDTQLAKHKDALMGQDAEYFETPAVVTETIFTTEASSRTVTMLQAVLGDNAAEYATMTAQHMAECDASDPIDLSRHATRLLANKLALAMPDPPGGALAEGKRLNVRLGEAIRGLPVLGNQAPPPPPAAPSP